MWKKCDLLLTVYSKVSIKEMDGGMFSPLGVKSSRISSVTGCV